jgi:hypothetical protein
VGYTDETAAGYAAIGAARCRPEHSTADNAIGFLFFHSSFFFILMFRFLFILFAFALVMGTGGLWWW